MKGLRYSTSDGFRYWVRNTDGTILDVSKVCMDSFSSIGSCQLMDAPKQILPEEIRKIKEVLVLLTRDDNDLDSVSDLDAIRDDIDQLLIAAVSRIRRSQHYIHYNEISTKIPEWFSTAKKGVNIEQNNSIWNSAEKLVSWLSRYCNVSGTCELDDKHLEICWDTPLTYVWHIKESYSWPLVNVTTYVQKNAGRPALHRQTYMVAHRLIEQAISTIKLLTEDRANENI